jgi:hypothetical protein
MFFSRPARVVAVVTRAFCWLGNTKYERRDYSAARIQTLQRSIALAQRSDESTTLSRRSSPFALAFLAIESASVQIASHASALTTSTAVLLRESKYKVVWRQGHEVGAEFVSVVRSGFALQN